MRIGVLADTHDRVPAVEEFLREFAQRGVTLVLHAAGLEAAQQLGDRGDAVVRVRQEPDPHAILQSSDARSWRTRSS